MGRWRRKRDGRHLRCKLGLGFGGGDGGGGVVRSGLDRMHANALVALGGLGGLDTLGATLGGFDVTHLGRRAHHEAATADARTRRGNRSTGTGCNPIRGLPVAQAHAAPGTADAVRVHARQDALACMPRNPDEYSRKVVVEDEMKDELRDGW